MLRHKNIASMITSGAEILTLANNDSKNSYVSYLPMAHVFERVIFNLMIYVKGEVGFYHGNKLRLMEDIALF